MTKKNSKKEEKPKEDPLQKMVNQQLPEQIPDEAMKKLDAIRGKLDKFKKKVLGKFEDYVIGISLLPPGKDEKDKNKINIMVLVDDADSKKMNKLELRDKLFTVVKKMSDEIDKNLNPDVVLLSELWQMCFDGKYEILQAISMSAPVHDTGMMAAIKIAEIHKSMVLKKFERYIVTYVLAGSLVQGRATHKSDIDVFIVIDDTDVKKMTRAELKDKLRAIIIGMGLDAGDMTGIKNKLNIQVYILTDFWDNVKEANPIIFTFLRDGVPFYDRGIFMPWKQLLQMGRVKPSPEAIDMYKSTGDQMVQRVKNTLKNVAMEDFFWATITPSQAALMMYGVAPPTPKETPELLRDIFVKKEKLLEEKYIKILEKILTTRKNLEHGDATKITGKEIDDLLKGAEQYLKRLGSLFSQIEELKEKESVQLVYEKVVTIVRDILRMEGVEKISDADIIKAFESEVVHKGVMPEKYLRILKNVDKAKKDYDQGKLNKTEINKVKKESRELIKFLVEHIQRERGKELDRSRIKVKHGKRFGEVLLLDKVAYIIHDIDNEDKEITKAKLNENGSLGNIQESSLEELEKAITTAKLPPSVFIKEPIFEDLKNIFGRDVEISLN